MPASDPQRGAPRTRATSLRIVRLAAAMAVAALIGAGVGLVAVGIDRAWLSPPPVDLGGVDSARTLLGAVAGGLITVAVFSLWMRTVVVGLVSDHFSPRTLVTFLEDRFQRTLLAAMAGGVVTVLVLLTGLPTEAGAAAPLVGTLVAVAVALAGLAGVLVAIQHATRSLSLPELVSRLANQALEVLGEQPGERVELEETPPLPDAVTVLAPGTGWVTMIDTQRLLAALPPGGVVHLRTRVGAFVTHRSPLALVSVDPRGAADPHASDPPAADPSAIDLDAIRSAVSLARTRSPEMDLAFAIGQLLDVGAYALHGTTDTATGHEVLVHLGAVLEAVVEQGLPRRHDADDRGRIVFDEAGWDTADHVQLCVERLREPAARDPEAARHLMHMLRRIREVADDVADRAVASEIGRQVETLLALVDANGVLPRDRQRLEREAAEILATD